MTYSIFSDPHYADLEPPGGVSLAAMLGDRKEDGPKEGETASIFEAATDDDRVGKFAKKQIKANAMGLALTWLSERDFSYDALDALAYGLADVDEDGQVGEDEEDHYNAILQETANAFAAMGADADNVADFISDESDEAGEKLGTFLSKKLDGVEEDDDELVSRYATSGKIFESSEGDEDVFSDGIFEGVVRVVRNGEVKLVKKRLKKRRMTAAQRAALKKARRKANTASARRARAKARRIRKTRGLK